MSSTKIALGALAGVAIGAIAGILLAPEKGSRTRRKIMDKGEDLTDELKSKFADFCDSITEKFENMQKDVKASGKGN